MSFVNSLIYMVSFLSDNICNLSINDLDVIKQIFLSIDSEKKPILRIILP